MLPYSNFDVIIIGGSYAGLSAAIRQNALFAIQTESGATNSSVHKVTLSAAL